MCKWGVQFAQKGEEMYIKQLLFTGEVREEFPFGFPFLKELEAVTFDCPVSFITGENGSGKSTILETIADLLGLNMEGGSKNNRFVTHQTHAALREECRLIRYPSYPKDAYFYRAESYYNLVSELDELQVSDELFERKLHTFSRGESLKELIKYRFFGKGIYLLDEPETGLSVASQLELIVLIDELVKQESQLIICTHSPILLLYPQAKLFELNQGHIREVEKEEAQIFKDWDMIMHRKDSFIRQLLREEE